MFLAQTHCRLEDKANQKSEDEQARSGQISRKDVNEQNRFRGGSI